MEEELEERLKNLPDFAIHNSKLDGVEIIVDLFNNKINLDLHFFGVSAIEKKLPFEVFMGKLEASVSCSGWSNGLTFSEEGSRIIYSPKTLFVFVQNGDFSYVKTTLRPNSAFYSPLTQEDKTFNHGAGLDPRFFNMYLLGFEEDEIRDINSSFFVGYNEIRDKHQFLLHRHLYLIQRMARKIFYTVVGHRQRN